MDDLIEDLKDGTRLLALLEVLSGEKLVIKFFIRFTNNSIMYTNSNDLFLAYNILAIGKRTKFEETTLSQQCQYCTPIFTEQESKLFSHRKLRE